MLVDLNKATALVNLAAEARRDYETTRLNPNATAASIHYRRDMMERALLDLQRHMEEHWQRFYSMFTGAMGVPDLHGKKKHGRARTTL